LAEPPGWDPRSVFPDPTVILSGLLDLLRDEAPGDPMDRGAGTLPPALESLVGPYGDRDLWHRDEALAEAAGALEGPGWVGESTAFERWRTWRNWTDHRDYLKSMWAQAPSQWLQHVDDLMAETVPLVVAERMRQLDAMRQAMDRFQAALNE
jgi:hypothetical protein